MKCIESCILTLLMSQHTKAKRFDKDPFFGYKIALVEVMISIVKYTIDSKLSSQLFLERDGCIE